MRKGLFLLSTFIKASTFASFCFFSICCRHFVKRALLAVSLWSCVDVVLQERPALGMAEDEGVGAGGGATHGEVRSGAGVVVVRLCSFLGRAVDDSRVGGQLESAGEG